MCIIIGQVIPFVGYLTTMDLFVTTVFGLLSLVVAVHFMTILMERKVHKYPLNIFFRDLLQWLFRAIWILMAVFIFISYFDINSPLFVVRLKGFGPK